MMTNEIMIKDGKALCTTDSYAKELKKKERGVLLYVIKDCQAAIDALPDNPNCTFYKQEIELCHAELTRRDERDEEQWRQSCQAERDMMGG